MKEVIKVLLVLAIFITPILAQSVPDPSQHAAGTVNNDAGTILGARPTLQTAEPQDIGWQFPWMRMIGGLGIVLCLLMALYLFAKKYAPRFFPKSASERNLKIIETLGMGDKRSISLIEFGNSRFLIGNTPHQINLLATLSEPLSLVSEPEDVLSDSKVPPQKESKSPFRSLFEVEKKRPNQYTGNVMPDDVRMKMRQLREALER
jgi:flagellar biosynthetic protein FliO